MPTLETSISFWCPSYNIGSHFLGFLSLRSSHFCSALVTDPCNWVLDFLVTWSYTTSQIIPPHTSISAQNPLSLHRSHTPSLHWTCTVCSLLQAPLQKTCLFFKVCLNYCLVHGVFCTYFLKSVCSLIRPSLLKVRYLEYYRNWGPTSVLLNENLHLNENTSRVKSWTLNLTSIGLAK